MPFMVTVYGQQPDVASKLGYPDLVIYNAKIVTMDDPSFESTVGTIVQAMAVREEKILATGSTAEIRALAGPQTQQIDLRGRTVLPSFIMTHEHPTVEGPDDVGFLLCFKGECPGLAGARQVCRFHCAGSGLSEHP